MKKLRDFLCLLLISSIFSSISYAGNWSSSSSGSIKTGDAQTLIRYWNQCVTKIFDVFERWVSEDPELLVKIIGKEMSSEMAGMPSAVRTLAEQHSNVISASDRRKLLGKYDLACNFDPTAFRNRELKAALYSEMAKQERLKARLEAQDHSLTYGDLLPKPVEFKESTLLEILESDPEGFERFGQMAIKDMDRMMGLIRKLTSKYFE